MGSQIQAQKFVAEPQMHRNRVGQAFECQEVGGRITITVTLGRVDWQHVQSVPGTAFQMRPERPHHTLYSRTRVAANDFGDIDEKPRRRHLRGWGKMVAISPEPRPTHGKSGCGMK